VRWTVSDSSVTARLSAVTAVPVVFRRCLSLLVRPATHPGVEGCHPGNPGTSARGARMECRGVHTRVPPPIPASLAHNPAILPLTSECAKVTFLPFLPFSAKPQEMTLTRRDGVPTYCRSITAQRVFSARSLLSCRTSETGPVKRVSRNGFPPP